MTWMNKTDKQNKNGIADIIFTDLSTIKKFKGGIV